MPVRLVQTYIVILTSIWENMVAPTIQNKRKPLKVYRSVCVVSHLVALRYKFSKNCSSRSRFGSFRSRSSSFCLIRAARARRLACWKAIRDEKKRTSWLTRLASCTMPTKTKGNKTIRVAVRVGTKSPKPTVRNETIEKYMPCK